MARREYRITTSAYGSFAPAPADGGVLLTTYDRLGYRVAEQRVAADDSLLIPVTPSRLPVNLVNPPRKRWDVVNLDTVRYTRADSVGQSGEFRAKRYRKVPNLVNAHSWMPVAFNPFAAVDEHVIDLNVGLTLISQNLLSSAEAYASYGWNRHEGSLVNLGVRYFGLGVRFDLDASYGGNQLFYSLAGRDGQGNPVYQSRPAPDKHYSVGLSATLPLYFQRGYHTRQLSLSAGWNYSNGMVADLGKIEWENGSISNIQRVGYREGLHKVSFGSRILRPGAHGAPRHRAPLGLHLQRELHVQPQNAHFSDLISFYGQAYTAGIRAPQLGAGGRAPTRPRSAGYKFPSGYAPLSYKSTRLVPRGFTSADIVSNNYTAFQANYQLPVWYPEGGIGSVIYIKRIRLNAGGRLRRSSATWAAERTTWRRIWSVGGDIVFDFNAFRQPASATFDLQAVVLPSVERRGVRRSVGGTAVLR